MRLRALLDTEALGLRLLGGDAELDRPVRGVMTTDLRDPGRYLSGGELVLTGLAWRRGAEDSEPFVRILADAGVAGLAVGEAELSGIPGDLAEACARHRLPLFAVAEAVAFATVTEHVVRQVSGERAGDLAAVVDRHRRLMATGPAGGAPDAVLDLLRTDLDLRARVLSPTGRRIAGEPLPDGCAPALAAAYLAASVGGRPGPHPVTFDGTVYSLFAVPGAGDGPASVGARARREAALSGWVLAVDADPGDWSEERLALLGGITQLVALERDRRDAARAARQRSAREILELVRAGAPPAEVATRLRVAGPVLAPGADAPTDWQIVVARLEWDGEPGTGAVAGSLLEEILATRLTDDRRTAEGVTVAVLGDDAVALIPGRPPIVPGDDAVDAPEGAEVVAGDAAERAGLRADGITAGVVEPLAAGLAAEGRLTMGVSTVVRSPDGLRGAWEEARHARRVAAARQGPVCAAGHHELASHVVLLPFVPDDVRRAFTSGLLDPLRVYDEQHRAELVSTLEAFLDCDGSWTRCASRLHLHVNTLRYRIGRIEQLTGRDLARLDDKLDFRLALRMS